MKKSRRRVLNCCGTLAVIRTARPASFWWARAGYASSMRVVWNWRVSGRAENAPGSPTFWLAMLRFFALSSVHLRQRAELPVSSGEDDGGFYGRGGNSEEKGGGESMVSFHRASSLSLFLLSQTYALFICLVGASLIVNMFVCQKRQQRYKLVVDAVSAMGSMTPSLNLEHLSSRSCRLVYAETVLFCIPVGTISSTARPLWRETKFSATFLPPRDEAAAGY